MNIIARKTKSGKVYDVRYYTYGKGSSRKSISFKKKIDTKDFTLHKEKEFMDFRGGFERPGSFEDTNLKTEIENWLNHGEIKFSSGHYKRAKAIIEQDLLPKYGNWTPNKFNLNFIPYFQKERKKLNRKSLLTPPKNAIVNRVTEVLCAILNFSTKQKRIPFNPMKGYEKLPDDTGEILFLGA